MNRTIVGRFASAGALLAVLVVGAGAASAQQPSGAAGEGVTVPSDTLHGSKVYDTDGKQLGTIEKLLIDPAEGKVASVVVKQGGTAGIGGKEVSVPWSALKVQRGDKGLVVTMQQQMLEKAPSASPGTDRGKSSTGK